MQIFGPQQGIGQLHDCSKSDTDGHGTWVASRIVGDNNGIGSNGIAPDAKVMGYKALATGFGGLTSWIADAMVKACNADADVINMSLGGYDDPNDPDFAKENVEDYFLWQDAVNYCRARGTTIVASAGNEHLRNLRQTVTLTGLSGTRTITGAGVVSTALNEGVNAFPGDTELQKYVNDYRGMLETPAGVPGVIMVSSSGNAIAKSEGNVVPAYTPPTGVQGTLNNLAYYSSYGERVDISAPGGARKYGVPKFDTRPGTDVLTGRLGRARCHHQERRHLPNHRWPGRLRLLHLQQRNLRMVPGHLDVSPPGERSRGAGHGRPPRTAGTPQWGAPAPSGNRPDRPGEPHRQVLGKYGCCLGWHALCHGLLPRDIHRIGRGPERDPLRLGVWGGHGQRRGGDLALARSAARRHSRTQSPPW